MERCSGRRQAIGGRSRGLAELADRLNRSTRSGWRIWLGDRVKSSSPFRRHDVRAGRPVPARATPSARSRGGSPDWRISSSIATGTGPSSPATSRRSASLASSGGGPSKRDLGARTMRGSIGRISSRMSAADWIRVAPSRIRPLQPLRAWIERRSGHGHHLPAHLAGQPGGDQRSGFRRPPRPPRCPAPDRR